MCLFNLHSAVVITDCLAPMSWGLCWARMFHPLDPPFLRSAPGCPASFSLTTPTSQEPYSFWLPSLMRWTWRAHFAFPGIREEMQLWSFPGMLPSVDWTHLCRSWGHLLQTIPITSFCSWPSTSRQQAARPSTATLIGFHHIYIIEKLITLSVITLAELKKSK